MISFEKSSSVVDRHSLNASVSSRRAPAISGGAALVSLDIRFSGKNQEDGACRRLQIEDFTLKIFNCLSDC